jgi:uncharacterized protein (TIGR00251 family)
MSIKETENGVLITIFVKPNSHKFAIEFEETGIVVYATEEPEKGKVNKEILKELSKIVHKKVELTAGSTSRQKQLAIIGAKKAEIEQLLKKK